MINSTCDQSISDLYDVIENYNKIKTYDSFSVVDFDTLYFQKVQSKLNINQTMDMNYVLNLYSKALNYSKELNFNLAEYYLIKADNIVKNLENIDNIIKYSQIYITPKKSYYYYKKQNYIQAHQLTWEAISQIEIIEDEFPDMHIGKIQQIQNISRILLREGKYEEAFNITNSILEYLLLNKIPKSLQGNWGIHLLSNCNKDFITMMTVQVFSESILNLLVLLKKDKKEFFNKYYSCFSDIKPHNETQIIYLYWIKSIICYYDNDLRGFYTNSKSLFSINANHFNILKCFNLICYLELLSNCDEISIIKFRVNDFIDKKLKLPVLIKDVFNEYLKN